MIRRVIGTTLACLCAVSGPLATSSSAAAPKLSTDVTSARPGVLFTLTPSVGCPSDDGAQTVVVSFADHSGTTFVVDSLDTDDDGDWGPAPEELPVAGLDEDGAWDATAVAPGAGTLSAACFAADESDDPDDPDSDDPDSDDPDGSGDDGSSVVRSSTAGSSTAGSSAGRSSTGRSSTGRSSDDDGSDDAPATLTYPGIAFAAVGAAPQMSLSGAMVKPGGTVTVTPAEGCPSGGPSTVDLGMVAVGTPAADPDEDDDSPIGDVTASVTTTSTGGWRPVTLTVPADADTVDYAVTATCSGQSSSSGSGSDGSGSDYDARPLAVGTAVIGAPVCGAKNTYVPLTGTYDGGVDTGRAEVSLPAKLALTGDGPWKVRLRSAATGLLLVGSTAACDTPRYSLEVPRTTLTDSGRVRARVCNSGRSAVLAVLQVAAKRYQEADRSTLDPGDCAWLDGPRLTPGQQVKARVLLDAPGTGDDDVVATFTAKRAKH